MPELLSICIPTYNRAPYLTALLDLLIPELEDTPGAAELVQVYISDNSSTDSTREVVDRFSTRWPIAYNCNPVNIGADGNFTQMIERASGTYFWLIGDDELMARGFLAGLLETLRPATHQLVILHITHEDDDAAVPLLPKEPDSFPNYTAFVEHHYRANPWELMAHSLISCMIIKRAIFDLQKSREMLKTLDRCYAHMYGLVEGIVRQPGSLYLDHHRTIILRTRRAKLYVVTSLEINNLWRRYYRWLGLKFGHPELIAYGRTLFGWRKWWRLKRRQLKSACGLESAKKS